jgi:hypothetical protein
MPPVDDLRERSYRVIWSIPPALPAADGDEGRRAAGADGRCHQVLIAMGQRSTEVERKLAGGRR